MDANMNKVELSEINRLAEDGTCIKKSYDDYNARVDKIVDYIIENEKRVVLVAGPSSSGKTTSSELIARGLRRRGKAAEVISMDFFFKPWNTMTVFREEDGTPDYEHVESIRMDYLHEIVNELMTKGRCEILNYHFGTRTTSTSVHDFGGAEDGIVVIEGLHALNPITSEGLPQEKIVKVYATIFDEIVDNGESFLNASEIRISRRLLRDKATRNQPVERTLSIIKGIEDGADRWVRPFRETADFELNTTFPCELGMLRGQILACCEDPEEGGAYRDMLLSLGERFKRVKETDINELPKDALIREFLGGLEL